MAIDLFTSDTNVSPVIDLERVNMILTTNRIDKPVTDFSTNRSIKQIGQDPHAAIYVSNTISPSSYPSVIKILNNEFEKSVLSLDDPLSNYLIYSLQYPLNHISHINFNEGIHLEPFSYCST